MLLVASALFHGCGLTHANCPKGLRLVIQWTLMTVQEDLFNAEVIAPLSSENHDAHQKAERLSKTANNIGLNVSIQKTHVPRKNTRLNKPILIDEKHLADVEEFTYFGTKLITAGVCDHEINTEKVKPTTHSPC